MAPCTSPLFKKVVLSIAEVSRNIYFLPHFHYFWYYHRCDIFQINTNFQIYQQKIFLRKLPYIPPSLRKKFLLSIAEILHRKRFSRHPLFTIFPLFLTVSEVCSISNKYLISYKWAKKCFYKETLRPSYISKKSLCSTSGEKFLKNHFLPYFYYVSQGMRFAMFQINTNLWVI